MVKHSVSCYIGTFSSDLHDQKFPRSHLSHSQRELCCSFDLHRQPPVDITRIPLRTVSNMWPFYCALRFIMKNKPETRQKLCRTVRQMLIGVSSAAFPSRNSIILSVESLLLGHKNGQQRQYMHSISWSTRMVQGFLKTIFWSTPMKHFILFPVK